MSNFNIKVVGSANLRPMSAQFQALQAQVERLNNEMRQTITAGNALGTNAQGYNRFSKAVRAGSQTFRDAAASTGLYEAQQLKLNSATDEYTRALKKQKISFNEWRKSAKISSAAYKEQIALQNMMVRKLPQTSGNKVLLDVITPNNVSKQLDTMGQRFGWFREQVRSATTQMVNWGKNTQWAGRQLMVGFTVPIAAFGAATGKLAYDVDKEITRIQKVYDTFADSTSTKAADMAAVESELAEVRTNAFNTAGTAAKQYGSSINDTLAVQAELAATGKQGAALQESTNQVMRIATLGEIEHSVATKALISLQSIMNMNVRETAQAFDYMNSIENATSLATEDFAKAIPIALGPLKEMGGNVQDLALLLVALKERGVEAGEGSNAIKSMMQRLYRPSKQIREEWQQLADVDLVAMVKDAGGDIMQILPQIQRAVEDLSRPERVQLLGGLFGTYQVARQSAILNGLKDAQEGIGQTSRVLETNEKGWKQWGDTAAGELERVQQSTAGKFNIAIQTLKVELAQFGEPFLEIGTTVIQVISRIVKAFNSMPEGLKGATTVGLIIAALIGPVVMLTGLFANMVGTVIRLGINVVGLGVKYELLTKESAAARLAAELTAAGFDDTGRAARNTTLMVEQMSQAMAEAAIVQKRFMGSRISMAPIDSGSASPAYAGAGKRRADMPTVVGPNVKDFASAEDSTKKMSAGMKTAAVSGAAMSVALGASMVSNNEMVDSAANWTMIVAGIGPLVAAIPFAKMASSIKATGSSMTSSFIPNIKKAGVGIKDAVLTFARFVGPTGLIVGAIAAFGILYTKINDNAEALEQMTQTGEKWAEIFNYERREPGTIVDPKTGKTVSDLTTRVKELNKAAPEVGESIRNAFQSGAAGMDQAKKEAIAMNLAIRQGLIVRSEGGSAEDARAAVETSLMSGIEDASKVKELMAQVDIKVDFNIDGQVMRQNLRQTMNQIQTAIDDEVDKTKAEAIFDFFGGNDSMFGSDLSDGSIQAGKNAAKSFYQSFESATTQQQIAMSRKMTANFEELMKNTIKPLTDNKELSALLGINSSTSGQEFLNMDFSAGQLKAIEDADYNLEGMRNKLVTITAQSRSFAREVGLSANLSGDTVANMLGLEDVLKKLVPSYMSIDDASRGMQNELRNAILSGQNLNDEQQLQILNQWRLKAGLKETNTLEDWFNNKVTDAKNGIKGQGDAMDGTNSKIAKGVNLMKLMANAAKNIDLGQVMRDTMSGIQSEIADSTMASFDSRMEASIEATQNAGERAIDGLQKRQEAAQKNLENMQERRREGIEKTFDKRIEAVNKAIEAEEAADDKRQKLFEAEMSRLDRLNDAANRNIDFNAALSAGNFDEAARIRNDGQADQEAFGLQAALDKASEKSGKKVDALGDRTDKLEDAKQKRLDAISDVEDREKEALRRTQERRSDALQAEVDANNTAAQKMWADRKAYVEKALNDFTGYTAMSTADLKKHIELWQKKYGDLNLSTKKMFNLTTDSINRYMKQKMEEQRRELVNAQAWESFGDKIAGSMIKGAFGMTKQQFYSWLATEENPPTGEGKTKKSTATTGGGFKPGPQNTVLHTGGLGSKIQGMSRGRVGFARNAPQSRNEVNALLKMGEYVVRDDSTAMYGTKKMDAVNAGSAAIVTPDEMARAAKAHVGGMGISGLAGASAAGIVRMAIKKAITGSKASASMSGSYAAGSASTKTSGQVIQGPGGKFRPVAGGSISQYLHDTATAYPAIDISVPTGTPVRAVASGKILSSYDIVGTEPRAPHGGLGYKSYGRVITQSVPGGSVLYAHLSQRYASAGDQVSGGSVLGKSGNTGYSFGDHLHFGASGMPPAVWLQDGAENIRWDNTLANLHHGESVLTQDLSSQFKQGVANFANGQSVVYDIDINGANYSDEKELVSAVITALDKRERRAPQTRQVRK